MSSIASFQIHGYGVVYIFWNLFLALIPCFVIYFLIRSRFVRPWAELKNSDRILLLLIVLFWLFFFPNAAYLFTIVRHLVDYCSSYDMYRVCTDEMWKVPFFFSYSLLGLPTFYYALSRMEVVIAQVFGNFFHSLFLTAVIPATSIGVMLGLFERFNTWQIISDPLLIVKTGFGYLAQTDSFLVFLSFTVSLYLIYFGTSYFLNKERS